jgi:hypothetical protein
MRPSNTPHTPPFKKTLESSPAFRPRLCADDRRFSISSSLLTMTTLGTNAAIVAVLRRFLYQDPPTPAPHSSGEPGRGDWDRSQDDWVCEIVWQLTAGW